MNKSLNFPKTIGFNVRKGLLSSRKLTVQGVTSKGIFLNTSQDILFFLSYEAYHGPNTLNFPGRRHPFQTETGETVQVIGDRLDFREFQISLAEPCQVWQPGPAVLDPNLHESYSCLIPLGQHVYQNKPDAGFSSYLPFYLEGHSFNDDMGRKLVSIRDAQDYRTILLDIFPSLSGCGTGLTPSGDDFIAGFLLFYCRSSLTRTADMESINQEFIRISKKKTTTLANNIIEGAAGGVAEERLLALVDYSHGAPGNLEDLAKCLLSYGNSSGIDSLLGVLAAAQRSV